MEACSTCEQPWCVLLLLLLLLLLLRAVSVVCGPDEKAAGQQVNGTSIREGAETKQADDPE